DVVLGFTCFQWDADALAFVFPNTAVLGSGRLIEWGGSSPTVPPGTPPTTRSNVVFAPRNAEHPGVILYAPAAVPDLNAELFLSAYRYLEIPAVVIALPDGSDRLGKMGRFASLSL